MRKDVTCITGANGYVGKQLVAHFAKDSSSPVLAMIHSEDDATFNEKKQAMMEEFRQRAIPIDCIEFYALDLKQEEPFLDVDKSSVKTIVHAASITRFNVSEADANEVNVEGTKRVLSFANNCENLKQYLQISTVYSSGLIPGMIEEEPLDKVCEFANHYERSKWEAEQILISQFTHLPWRIARICTIIADDDLGNITQYNVFHNTIKLLYLGLTSIIPGEADTPLYFITGSVVVESLIRLLESDEKQHQIYHISPDVEQACTLGNLLDWVFDEFEKMPEFKKKRILRPLTVDFDTFDSLAETLDGMAGLVLRQALESMRPFSQQMYIRKEMCNQKWLRACSDTSLPDMEFMTRNVVKQLLNSKRKNI